MTNKKKETQAWHVRERVAKKIARHIVGAVSYEECESIAATMTVIAQAQETLREQLDRAAENAMTQFKLSKN